MKLKILIFFLLIINNILIAQNHKYYVRAIDKIYEPIVLNKENSLKYNGEKTDWTRLFQENRIIQFEKSNTSFNSNTLKGVFYIEMENYVAPNYFFTKFPETFEFAEYLGTEDPILLYYPNDYGTTGGANQGAPANLKYLDFLNVPNAWDYEQGDLNIAVGISDGELQYQDDDFDQKTTILPAESSSSIQHGTNVTAITAAQGNNAHSGTGVCFDCSIIKNGYGNYNRLEELYLAGALVINCSWAGSSYSSIFQETIDSIAAKRVIVVASSGNESANTTHTFPSIYKYPASYNNVISVAGVGSGNDLDCANIQSGTFIPNVKNYLSGKVVFTSTPNCSLPLESQVELDITGSNKVTTLNDKVDILAPGSGQFRHYQYVNDNVIEYVSYENGYITLYTSPAAPLVTGTIGLMKSLNKCLTYKEVESILKISSINIDNIPANQVASGYYGSGTLNTGNSVRLTYELISPSEIAYLENQKFNRWDFIFNGVSESIVIQNQEFTNESTVTVTAKNEIILEEGTFLEPDEDGFALFVIDSGLTIETNCPTTDPDPFGLKPEDKTKKSLYIVYPTNVKEQMNIENRVSNEVIIKKVEIYDIFNQKVFEMSNVDTPKIFVNLGYLTQGFYILKGYDQFGEDILTTKFIKE